MNNSFFGKICEDIRKYKDVRIIIEEKKVKKFVKKDGFNIFKIYNENLVVVFMDRNSVELNKLRYIGMIVLNFVKLKMNDFYYNYIMKTFFEIKLLVIDIDFFCYEIISEKDIYDVIKGNDWFDFFNYDKDYFLFDDSKKLKLGYFKDEFGGKILFEVIGLRFKMYSIFLWIGLVKSAVKGVNKIVRDGVIIY